MESGITKPSNATLKTSWSDNGDGTYTATYEHTTAGTGQNYKLALSEWGASYLNSGNYAVTAGSPSATRSSFSVPSFIAYPETGETFSIALRLYDEYGNPVGGLLDAVKSSFSVTGGLTTVDELREANTGNYVATFSKEDAITRINATLSWVGWSSPLVSANFNIVPAQADIANSTFSVDKATYKMGETISVTVTLKDKRNKAVTNQAPYLNASDASGLRTLTSNYATSSLDFVSHPDGTYTGTFVARTVSNNASIVLKGTNWSSQIAKSFAINP